METKFDSLYRTVQSVFSDTYKKPVSDPNLLFIIRARCDDIPDGGIKMKYITSNDEFNIDIYSVEDILNKYEDIEVEAERIFPYIVNTPILVPGVLHPRRVIVIDESARLSNNEEQVFRIIENICILGIMESAGNQPGIDSHILGNHMAWLLFLKYKISQNPTINAGSIISTTLNRMIVPELIDQDVIDIITKCLVNEDPYEYGNLLLTNLNTIIGIDDFLLLDSVYQYNKRYSEIVERIRAEETKEEDNE